ncbi:uncharacterized protein PGTG_12873 [Puccinia graminis f. sp. tritici CRL 75-36-700-3]|uniref:Uncharacterized protein n=1 Tax=Puccinia graminis f. sp. tritici (strain CRL 75-36-700-3 / race SCCL) TaxID=418459 RepID=E3KSK3_PUCGT|nr:uncharacterized protein PGTG_12873 [Puccinia graminis f. sp. tritici CRL 75-36-700-3]EFP87289.1 hypothetical protein PGTG_12873 [Puccinia graminis f. sp. tritici CRL 75-36-700-3]
MEGCHDDGIGDRTVVDEKIITTTGCINRLKMVDVPSGKVCRVGMDWMGGDRHEVKVHRGSSTRASGNQTESLVISFLGQSEVGPMFKQHRKPLSTDPGSWKKTFPIQEIHSVDLTFHPPHIAIVSPVAGVSTRKGN